MDGVDVDDGDGVDVDNVDRDGVDGGDGDVLDDWLLSVTRPNCDLGSPSELFKLFCGMNVKQLTFD